MANPFLKIQFFQRPKPSPPSLPFLSHLTFGKEKKNDSNFQNSTIGLYDAYHLHQCPWPQTVDGQYAKRFLTPLIQQGVHHYIENIRTDLRVLIVDELALPVTINEEEYENSYVCSPYSYYVSYARESLGFLKQAWVYHALNSLLWGLGKVLRCCRINKVVSVNNWFYSTTLYPKLRSEQLVEIVQFLHQRFPDHAIVFRSIDPHTSSLCYQTLQQMGLEYIANRQIFFLDPKETSFFDSRLFKSDVKLLGTSGYEILDENHLSEKDFPRLIELYKSVYIDKYSALNPQFNEEFLHLMLTQRLMHFKVLKKEGHINGVIGYMQRNGMMYCPLFGYDQMLPKEPSLYRMLSTLLMLEAQKHQLFFHQSSGASMFKKIRKANSCFEYTAVYYQHLNRKRRIPWQILKEIYNKLGVFYMTKY